MIVRHESSSASQAENAGSIPVARSRLDFVVTTDKVVGNIAVGFRHCSSLFAPIRHVSLSQHCRSTVATRQQGVNHVSPCPAKVA